MMDLVRVAPQTNPGDSFELMARGEVVIMPPAGPETSVAAVDLADPPAVSGPEPPGLVLKLSSVWNPWA